MGDGGAELALDVVADDRDAGCDELGRPLRIARDEHRLGVDERDTRIQRRLGVVLRGRVGADRHVADQHVGAAVPQHLRGVNHRGIRFRDGRPVVLAETVQGRTALHGHAGRGNVRELQRVVLAGPDRIRQLHADLEGVDVERRHELEVADGVLAEAGVHEPGDGFVGVGILVESDALHERIGAVSDTGDGNPKAHEVQLLDRCDDL